MSTTTTVLCSSKRRGLLSWPWRISGSRTAPSDPCSFHFSGSPRRSHRHRHPRRASRLGPATPPRHYHLPLMTINRQPVLGLPSQLHQPGFPSEFRWTVVREAERIGLRNGHGSAATCADPIAEEVTSALGTLDALPRTGNRDPPGWQVLDRAALVRFGSCRHRRIILARICGDQAEFFA